jgi:L-ascorbate metabolism protein UlaG (beta-lactamase superfamily)
MKNINIDFKWFGGGNWMIVANGVKIVCDPVLCPAGTIHNYRYFKSKRINPPVFSDDDIKNVDLWLFTHGHKDHCDFWNYKPIIAGCKIISDISASVQLKKHGCENVQILRWQEKSTLTFPNGIKMVIEAVPAIHGFNAGKGKLVGNGNGYIVDMCYGDKMYSLYTTGDTLPNRETIKAIRNKSFDVVIANAGNAVVGKGLLAKLIGRITMNISDVIFFQKHLKTKAIIPIHWDAFEHYRERNIAELSRDHGFLNLCQGEITHLL